MEASRTSHGPTSGPGRSTSSITASATSWSRASLFGTWRYSAIGVTPSSVASARMVRRSRPSSLVTRMAPATTSSRPNGVPSDARVRAITRQSRPRFPVLLSILVRWHRRSGPVRTSRSRHAPTAGSRCAPRAAGPGRAGSGCRPRCSAPTTSPGSTSCARQSTKVDPAWLTEGGRPRCSTRSSATCRSSTARSR